MTIIDTPLDPSPAILYWVSAIAAISFGFIRWKKGAGWLLWGISGGLFALLLTTLAWGLGTAAAVPYTDEVRKKHQAIMLVLAIIILVIIGLILERTSAPPNRAAGTPVTPPSPAPPTPPK